MMKKEINIQAEKSDKEGMKIGESNIFYVQSKTKSNNMDEVVNNVHKRLVFQVCGL